MGASPAWMSLGRALERLLMAIISSRNGRHTVSRLNQEELSVLEKFGQDKVTIGLEVTLKPMTWLALQKYALKEDCSLSESVADALESSGSVAECVEIDLAEKRTP